MGTDSLPIDLPDPGKAPESRQVEEGQHPWAPSVIADWDEDDQ